MTGVEKVLAVAQGELGVKESPAESNCVKYNTEYYGRKVSGASYPWCCTFLWWCFWKAGLQFLFFNGNKTASCGALASYAKKEGRFVESGFRPGDLAFFRFSGKAIQHIGIVESLKPDGSLVTIEGNTGSRSQANGGEVQRRVRPMRYTVGAYRPKYGEDEMTQAEFYQKMETWLQQRSQQEPGAFSHEARVWAEKNGIIQGNTEGALQYKSYCTREQMVVFLYRFLKMLEEK